MESVEYNCRVGREHLNQVPVERADAPDLQAAHRNDTVGAHGHVRRRADVAPVHPWMVSGEIVKSLRLSGPVGLRRRAVAIEIVGGSLRHVALDHRGDAGRHKFMVAHEPDGRSGVVEGLAYELDEELSDFVFTCRSQQPVGGLVERLNLALALLQRIFSALSLGDVLHGAPDPNDLVRFAVRLGLPAGAHPSPLPVCSLQPPLKIVGLSLFHGSPEGLADLGAILRMGELNAFLLRHFMGRRKPVDSVYLIRQDTFSAPDIVFPGTDLRNLLGLLKQVVLALQVLLGGDPIGCVPNHGACNRFSNNVSDVGG
jgi:hypothetical protein